MKYLFILLFLAGCTFVDKNLFIVKKIDYINEYKAHYHIPTLDGEIIIADSLHKYEIGDTLTLRKSK